MSLPTKQEEKPKFKEILESYRHEIVAATPEHLAKHLNPDRIIRLAMSEFRRIPQLAKCHPQSVCSAIIVASQLGLEIGVTGDGWLIPYKDECQFIPGYQGLIKLAHNSGFVADIEAHIVYAKDHFEIEFGSEKRVIHRPHVDGDRGEMRLVYGLAWLRGHDKPHFDFMSREQVYAIRNRSSGYRSATKYGRTDNPWIDPEYEPEMWRKTMLRRLSKQIPKSAAMNLALALDDAADRGRQGLGSFKQAIEGDFAPVSDEQAGPDASPAGQAGAGAAQSRPSIDEVARMIEAATGPDDVDTAVSMIEGFSKDEQKEIMRAAMERKKELMS